MDYGVPAALGVAPELMEEVSTGVSARPPPVQKEFPPRSGLVFANFPRTTPFD